MRTAAIIPLYNKASTIVRTLTSIRRQTVQVDEIIMVNDGRAERFRRQNPHCHHS